jgi:membrane protease subunit HflK
VPWSNQGGGPLVAGPKEPWGKSSGPSPPELEEILRRSQDKLRSVIPGGNLSGKGIIIVALLAVARESIKLRPTNSGSCCGSGATYATRNQV